MSKNCSICGKYKTLVSFVNMGIASSHIPEPCIQCIKNGDMKAILKSFYNAGMTEGEGTMIMGKPFISKN